MASGSMMTVGSSGSSSATGRRRRMAAGHAGKVGFVLMPGPSAAPRRRLRGGGYFSFSGPIAGSVSRPRAASAIPGAVGPGLEPIGRPNFCATRFNSARIRTKSGLRTARRHPIYPPPRHQAPRWRIEEAGRPIGSRSAASAPCDVTSARREAARYGPHPGRSATGARCPAMSRIGLMLARYGAVRGPRAPGRRRGAYAKRRPAVSTYGTLERPAVQPSRLSTA